MKQHEESSLKFSFICQVLGSSFMTSECTSCNNAYMFSFLILLICFDRCKGGTR